MTTEAASGLHSHNAEAERIVLGVVLAGEDEDGLALRRLVPDDFYNPEHRLLFETFKELDSDGSPRDARAVATTLAQRKLIGQIPGGAPYLYDLTEHAPASAALKHYVDAVKDCATTRNVAQFGMRAQQLATKGGENPAAMLESMRVELESLSEGRASDDIPPITDIIAETLNEIDILQTGRAIVGIPTGFTDLDERLNGLQPGQLVVIAARPAMGKALHVTTPILTVSGWQTMETLACGDYVYGRNGEPTEIVAATPVMYGRDCFEITFDDGSTLIADADHQWTVTSNSPADVGEHVLTSLQMFKAAHGVVFRIHSPSTPVGVPALPEVRTIVSIQPTASVPVRCIEVAAEDHLYLAGSSLVPTHNSSLALDFARHAAFRQDKAVLIFSLEMSHRELSMRALAAEAYVDLGLMRTENGIDDTKWKQLDSAASRMAGKRLGIDDSATTTLSTIRAKARMWQRRNGLDLVVVDYLQLMNPDRPSASRQQDVAEMSRGLKLLAKELGVPVIALSQLNRGAEQRADKRPALSDLRESGAIEQDADVVLLVHREDEYDRESPRAGEADIIIAKQRNGPTGTVVLSWLGKYTRFDNRTYN